MVIGLGAISFPSSPLFVLNLVPAFLFISTRIRRRYLLMCNSPERDQKPETLGGKKQATDEFQFQFPCFIKNLQNLPSKLLYFCTFAWIQVFGQ